MSDITSATTAGANRASSGSLRDNAIFKALFVDPWSYRTGAVILALLNIILLAATSSGWGVTTALTYWGAWIWEGLGGNPHSWAYFAEASKPFNNPGHDLLHDAGSLSNLGLILGAALSVLLASQFRIKKVKSGKQIVAAILGGLMMGVGARMAFGCNIGAMFTGLPSMSLHGWVFMVAIFLGAAIGSRLLVKYFI